MKKQRLFSVALLIMLFALATVNAQLVISPSSYDFGDVEVGTSASVIITITNLGFGSILIDSQTLVPNNEDFSSTCSRFLPDSQDYLESTDFTVSFTPSSIGIFDTDLVIQNGEAFVVPLRGTGVPAYPSTVVDIIDFINVSVSNETLEGAGNGNSANGRLNALINMLNQASNLINAGDYEAACGQLSAALKRCDDFVEGAAQNDLKQMIAEAMNDLGC